MIYSKVDNPNCRLCANADTKPSDGNVKCRLKGVVPEDFCCKKFKYDIFKREIKPHRTYKTEKFKKEDFIV